MKRILKPVFVIAMVVVAMIGVMVPSVFAEDVPDWVKNIAGWWAEDTISEKEFVNAVGFLINEIVITNEHEGMCDESIDKNRNGIPDEF